MARKVNHTKEAARALSDLNMLYAIIALCEHSLMHDCDDVCQKIGKICRTRAAYLLEQYDKHVVLAAPAMRSAV